MPWEGALGIEIPPMSCGDAAVIGTVSAAQPGSESLGFADHAGWGSTIRHGGSWRMGRLLDMGLPVGWWPSRMGAAIEHGALALALARACLPSWPGHWPPTSRAAVTPAHRGSKGQPDPLVRGGAALASTAHPCLIQSCAVWSGMSAVSPWV